MTACTYLTGENIAPRNNAAAKALIGKRVTYLCRRDIDRTGRGLYFPRTGTVAAVIRREIAMDHPMNFVVNIGGLVEMIELKEEAQ